MDNFVLGLQAMETPSVSDTTLLSTLSVRACYGDEWSTVSYSYCS